MKQSKLKLVTTRHEPRSEQQSLNQPEAPRILIVTQHPGTMYNLPVEYDLCDTSLDAVRLAQRTAYAAIFVDMMQLRCRTSGTKIIFLLRQANVLSPVVLMSAAVSLTDRTYAIRRGAIAMITRDVASVMQILPSFTQSIKLPEVSAPVVSYNNIKEKIVYMLCDFTGPAAEDQAQSVVRRLGPGVAPHIFIDALASYITNPSDGELFIKQASKCISESGTAMPSSDLHLT